MVIPRKINSLIIKEALAFYYNYEKGSDSAICPSEFELSSDVYAEYKNPVVLVCPMCDEVAEFNKGTTEGDGSSTDPYASCECGFVYKPEVKTPSLSGDNGGEYTKRKHKIIEDSIFQKLGK